MSKNYPEFARIGRKLFVRRDTSWAEHYASPFPSINAAKRYVRLDIKPSYGQLVAPRDGQLPSI